jgi:lysozyme family protein
MKQQIVDQIIRAEGGYVNDPRTRQSGQGILYARL